MADNEKRSSAAATPRRRRTTKKEKDLLQHKSNQDNLASAIMTL
jgi:hypothetical protein